MIYLKIKEGNINIKELQIFDLVCTKVYCYGQLYTVLVYSSDLGPTVPYIEG